MEGISSLRDEQSPGIVRQNLARIQMVVGDGALLTESCSSERMASVTGKFTRWGLAQPVILLLAHNEREREAAEAR